MGLKEIGESSFFFPRTMFVAYFNFDQGRRKNKKVTTEKRRSLEEKEGGDASSFMGLSVRPTQSMMSMEALGGIWVPTTYPHHQIR